LEDLLKKIFQNRSTRVLVILFISLLILVGYFLTYSYYVQLDIHKSKVLDRLDAIAKTAASQVNGNQLEYLFDQYPKIDDIHSNTQDKVYELIHDHLQMVAENNNLNSTLYTLSYDSLKGVFLFGVNSSDKPFFRHEYEGFPQQLMELYEVGCKVDVYEDENGHWLSAFYPVINSQGNVVGVVQADNHFDDFLEKSQKEILINTLISLAFALLIFFLLIRTMSSILSKEDRLTANLMQSKLELEAKNQETLDSILYAKRIQDAILPQEELMKQAYKDLFVLHQPRDIVSGDFYWFKSTRGKHFLACVDCTGHGVPGAFMSMIGAILLDDIINKKRIDDPSQILLELHKGVVKALKQNKKEKASRDGMDVALCVVDEQEKMLHYSGALRPLIHFSDGQLNRIKADPIPIGGFKEEKPTFKKHSINYSEGDKFYVFSDGYADQFGGERNKKFMIKKFRGLLNSIATKKMEQQKNILELELKSWMGECDQVDDILVIGFQPCT